MTIENQIRSIMLFAHSMSMKQSLILSNSEVQLPTHDEHIQRPFSNLHSVFFPKNNNITSGGSFHSVPRWSCSYCFSCCLESFLRNSKENMYGLMSVVCFVQIERLN